MTLLAIALATFVGGILSVGAAALVTYGALRAWVPRLVAFAVGMLLGVALLDLLPHAAESDLDSHTLFGAVLAGLVAFFILEKIALWRHGHPHVNGDAGHSSGAGPAEDDPAVASSDAAAKLSLNSAAAKHPAGAMIVVGDGVHNFVDGVLIAAAFLTDFSLGVTTTIAVYAHEIPQEIGDFLVLIQSGYSRGEALLWNAVASLMAVVGGLLGYLALAAVNAAIPYALAVSAASFLYIAISDLVPMLHRSAETRTAVAQVALILLGIGVVFVRTELVH